MRVLPASFFFFLLFFGIAYGMTYYAGSTLHVYTPNCMNASVYISCTDKIEENEFNVSPNCILRYNTTITEDWRCICDDSDEVKIYINPASNNTCEFVVSYVSTIEIPERKIVKRYYYSSGSFTHVVNNVTVYNVTSADQNKTINTIASQISNITRNMDDINKTLKNVVSNITAMNTNIETTGEMINSKFRFMVVASSILLFLVLLLVITR